MLENLLNQLFGQFKYIPRSLLIFILFSLSYMFIKEHGRDTIKELRNMLRKGWLGAFIMYAAYMFTSTILVRYNKNPFNAVFTHFWFIPGEIGYNNEIIKNVLFFIPFTFLLLQALEIKHPVKTCAVVSACATLFIEFSQLLFWIGQFQVADMIDNFIGGMIGCGLWLSVTKTHKKHLFKKAIIAIKRRLQSFGNK